MIQFRKITLNDKKLIDNCLAEGKTDGSSYSFGSLFCWGESYSIEIAEFDGMVLMRGADDYGRYYAYPSGQGDIKAAILEMMNDCRSDGEIFRLVQILEANKKELEELFPDEFQFSYDRDASEYVYSTKNMAELPGKKFHGKKGHVNAFFRNHSDISCDPITKDNIHFCLDIARSWLAVKDGDFVLDAEFRAIKKALDNYDALEYEGAILFADGRPVAFTMGEKLKNNTFCTHFEKTLPEYRDAYPVINNGFTKLMLMTYDYVNREEDMGQEGLRKAKLSYQPVFLVDKYCGILRNDPSRKYAADSDDIPGLKSLWKNVFGDSDAVVDAFFEKVCDISDVYAFKKDGKVVSAFYLIDAPVRNADKILKAKYLYAAATLPEYRNCGIMGEMIEYAINILKVYGYQAIYLFPANDHLYDYYRKFGFEKKFCCSVFEPDRETLEKYKGQRYFYSDHSYSEMREYVAAENYADFGASYLDFARFCSKNGGFELSVVFDDEDKVFIIGHYSDNVMYVDEAFSSQFDYGHILGVLADQKYKKIILKTPSDVEIESLTSRTEYDGMMNIFADDDNIYYLGQPCM